MLTNKRDCEFCCTYRAMRKVLHGFLVYGVGGTFYSAPTTALRKVSAYDSTYFRSTIRSTLLFSDPEQQAA